ncbi:DUF6114 domain-containing protein [Streptomyces sp. NPDC090025]|uniref:DUF6114 domain-containing protein n=1 Tax=Streptomyces sp. NPDC090025 TaxID=3365922 RepID=UPI003836836D
MRTSLALGAAGLTLLLLTLAAPTTLAPLALSGLTGLAGSLTLLAASALTRPRPHTRPTRTAVALAVCSCTATALGGYPVGLVLGIVAILTARGRVTSDRAA